MNKRTCGTKQYKLNAAQRTLVEDNYGLVPYTVSRYFCVPQRDLDDVLQIGAIGLCRAAYEYDPDKQCSFATFAVRCICTHVRHHFHLQYSECRDPRRELLAMDAPINTGDRGSYYLVDYLPDEATDVEEEACGRLEAERLLRALADVPMTDKERYVLQRHLAGETLRQIGQTMGVTRTRAGQALLNARRKVRDWLDIDNGGGQKEEPKMRDNPEFPPLVAFVVYNPETDAYMTARVGCGSGGHCTYWAKDVRRARRYRDKRYALNAAKAIERDGHGKPEVRMLEADADRP